MSVRLVLLIVSLVSAGLMAGLFFGWSVSVIPGLRRVDDRSYVQTMQSINVAIVNPVFVIPFFVTPMFLAAAAIAEYRVGNTRRAWVLGVAAATYLFGVLGVTVGGNIPLNDQLDAFDLPSSQSESLRTARADYEQPWNRWHTVRTVLSVVTFAIAAVAATIATEDA